MGMQWWQILLIVVISMGFVFVVVVPDFCETIVISVTKAIVQGMGQITVASCSFIADINGQPSKRSHKRTVRTFFGACWQKAAKAAQKMTEWKPIQVGLTIKGDK